MNSIFQLQWIRLRREPLLLISMVGMTIAFITLFGGFSSFEKMEIPTYFANDITEPEKEQWFDRLNESGVFHFTEKNKQDATKEVALGYVNFALELSNVQYRILMTADHQNFLSLKQFISQQFAEEQRLREVEEQIGNDGFREQVLSQLETPPISVEKTSLSNDQTVGYDPRTQALFGMTLFFVIYTIMFSLAKVALEKRTKTWERLILSPVKKWQVYFGYMFYTLLIGFVQISLIFVLFKYVFNFPLGDKIVDLLVIALCYSFAIVALGLLLMGISKTMEQLNALIPIVSVSMAMLGGAYWPIEIVSNKIILFLSKITPITYGMDALKRVSMGGQGLADISDSLGVLLLMGVIFVGIGINLMERRS
ncbi:ABC transporter permease [Bacillaceae bacterium W0354]